MTATITPVIDSAEWVWDERSTFDDALSFADWLGIDDSVISAAAIVLLKRNLATAWANEGHTMVDVPADNYDQLIDAEHLPAEILPDLDLCESVWSNALNALDFDDIIAVAGLTAEYTGFVQSQSDYHY
jgi:hypothetical protein